MATTKRRAFTLIELLVTISIIGLLTSLMVTDVNRFLGKNRLAEATQLFQSKIDQAKILSGARDTNDRIPTLTNPTDQETGYYAVYLPGGTDQEFFYLLRVSSPLPHIQDADHPCTLPAALSDPACQVEKISLGQGTKMRWSNSSINNLVAFVVPTQKLVNLFCATNCNLVSSWRESPGGFYKAFMSVTGETKRAEVKITNYTGQIKVTYY